MHRLSRYSALTLLTAGALFASACSASDSTDATGAAGNSGEETLKIVTSTAVWGDIAKAVADSDTIEVTAIVEGNDADPHSFEASAQDMARAMEADIVVVGGGGYDAWLYQAIEDQDRVVHALPLSADSHDHGDHEEAAHEEEADHEGHEDEAGHADETGTDPHAGHDHTDHEGFEGIDSNEHIWYDTEAVSQVAEDIAAKITELNPAAEVDTADLQGELDGLQQRIESLPDLRAAQTEPTGDYLLAHAGMSEVTPEGYRASSLSHSEPSAADLADFLALIQDGGLDLLIDNPQTSTDTTDRIRQAAEEADIPVVEIFETPATGENFFEFFNGAIDRFETGAGDLPETAGEATGAAIN
ncbi:metal ABC transporter solute-binding protein, Zn/Mn family [Corynebacterium sp. A21]|uniref:metal ABC transporter solute-binding protein, Zn/Mn family n=1 Tax=Corynebacterium sp. A21 TaxID=3457318 RepID=UPI003FD27313